MVPPPGQSDITRVEGRAAAPPCGLRDGASPCREPGPQGGTILSKRKKIIIGVVTGVIVLGILGAVFGEDEEAPVSGQPAPRAKTAPAATAVPTATSVPLAEVTPDQLLGEREANAVRYDAQYKGKQVRITGEVEKIERRVSLISRSLIGGVDLKDLPDDDLISLNIGDVITATCRVGDYVLGTITLDRCVLETGG